MTEIMKSNRKGNWYTEQVYFSDLKDGNQVFYLADPLSVDAPRFVPPMYPGSDPQAPDAIVWVMCEAWLVDRMGRNPCVKKGDPIKGMNSAVSGIINDMYKPGK